MTGGGGGSSSGDGRLDLDELGEIVDAPGGYRLGDADADSDVLGDDSRVSLGERLENAGVLPWVRRHRVLLGATAAVVVGVGVAGTAYASSRPPDAATVPGVTLVSADGDGVFYSGDANDASIVLQTYGVVKDASTATAVVDAVRGPGVRSSSGIPDLGNRPGVQAVGALLDCDDRALTAAEGQYRVHVTTTDLWGRTVAGWLEPPASNFGWSENVLSRCWQSLAAAGVTTTVDAVEADVASSSVRLALTVTSDLPVAAQIGVDGAIWPDVAIPEPSYLPVEPRSRNGAEAVLVVRDCSSPPGLPDVTAPAGQPNAYQQVPGIQVSANAPDRPWGSTTAAAFDEPTQQKVRSALDLVCAGAPAVSLRTATWSPALSLGSAVQVPVNVRLSLPRAVTATGSIESAGIPADSSGIPLDVRDGRVSVPWVFVCDFVPPAPDLSLTVAGASGRTWPMRIPLPVAVMADAVVASCPGMTRERLVDEGGWVFEDAGVGAAVG